MSHDHRKDRIQRGMIMTGQPMACVCKGVSPPSPAQTHLDELTDLQQRLLDVQERLQRIKAGDYS